MAFGIKKQAVIAKPSFKERLTGVKSMFKKAHEDASNLKLRKRLKSLCQILKSSFNENKFN